MTYMEAFEKIKKQLVKINVEVLPHDFAMQVNLTDEDCGGIFYIANIGGVFSVEPYDYYDHTVLLEGNSKDLLNIIAGKLDATDAIFRSIISVEGNMDHALALSDAFKKAPAKKAAKKTATKKAAEKKAPAKKAAEKKTATKKVADKKAPAKKAAEKKTATKKAADKKAPAKKAAEKKTATKKTAKK